MNTLDQFKTINPGDILTVFGVGFLVGVPAKDAPAGWPMGIARRDDGHLIVVDYWGHRIWRIDNNGILHLLAGNGVPGDSGDGGPCSKAQFDQPHDLRIDKHGNLFISDLGNNKIRRIDSSTGIVTTIAGNGKVGRGGKGGLATNAELDTYCGIAIDSKDNIYISSEWANNILRIDAQTGIIELFAGWDARHHPSETKTSRPMFGPTLSMGGYHGDGGPAKKAGFYHPEHLEFDSKGDLFVCDNSNNRIREIDMKTGIISTVFGNGQTASNGDGGPAVEASVFMPDAICFDKYDNLYVGEKYGFRIRKVNSKTGIVETLVGNGVPGFGEEGLTGQETHCNSCEVGLWVDNDGKVLWTDCSGRVRQFDPITEIVTTVLGGTTIHDNGPASKAFLRGPGGLSIGPNGHIYIADTFNQRIRVVDPSTGIIKTVAGNGARAHGGDNGPALQAYLGNPYDVSVDSKGRVVIADTRHGHVRRVNQTGIITAVAGTGNKWDTGDGGPANSASLMHVISVEHSISDDIFLGDGDAGRIRKIDSNTNIIETIAGKGIKGYSGDNGLATSAEIGSPTAIRIDNQHNIYFCDSYSHTVRKIDNEGIITTIIGTGEPGYSPDKSPLDKAMLNSPSGLEISTDGSIYISDSGNNQIRKITVEGNLETVVGTGKGGDGDDNDLAINATLNWPSGLRLYKDTLLLLSDRYNNKVKAVNISAQ